MALQLWKTYPIDLEEWARWEVGPLVLFALPRRQEWAFAWYVNKDPLLNSASFEMPSSQRPDDESCEFARFAGREMLPSIILEPKLGDRAFVVRPDLPLSLLAGEEGVLFISTVLWVTASIESNSGESERRTLLDMPAYRPSDTWFGPNTLKGELCYASRTNARTDLSEVSSRPHRAITPVEIVNRGEDALIIEQLRVPVSTLCLYRATDGQTWTDAVRLTRAAGEREAELKILKTSDNLPAELIKVSEPRETIEPVSIVDAFSRFLG